MELTAANISAFVGSVIWPFFRIGAFMMILPVLGTRMVPARIRLLLTFIISVVAIPMLKPVTGIDVFSLSAVLVIFQQILIGIAMGFIFQIVFQVFVMAGQLIAMQSGLGFASMIDPGSGVSVPLVGQFYLMLVSLIFLALDGHLMAIQSIVNSFDAIPVAATGISAANLMPILNFSAVIFSGAVLTGLPIIIALLTVNLAFGVMTRAAPQLNIFSIGFPISLTLALILIFITLRNILPQFTQQLTAGMTLINQM